MILSTPFPVVNNYAVAVQFENPALEALTGVWKKYYMCAEYCDHRIKNLKYMKK